MKRAHHLSPRSLQACLLLLFIFVPACSTAQLPTSAPTATLPTGVDSAFKSHLIGTWKITNGGPWGDALLTFEEEGNFSVTGGLQEPEAHGIYIFTAEDAIAFQFPRYSGTVQIKLLENDQLSLTVGTSDSPFGSLYSAVRVR